MVDWLMVAITTERFAHTVAYAARGQMEESREIEKWLTKLLYPVHTKIRRTRHKLSETDGTNLPRTLGLLKGKKKT